MRYVLLFVDTEQFANDLQAMDPAERERAFQQADKWFADHAGKLRGGSKLRAPETATTFARSETGSTIARNARSEAQSSRTRSVMREKSSPRPRTDAMSRAVASIVCASCCWRHVWMSSRPCTS